MAITAEELSQIVPPTEPEPAALRVVADVALAGEAEVYPIEVAPVSPPALPEWFTRAKVRPFLPGTQVRRDRNGNSLPTGYYITVGHAERHNAKTGI